jgi:hypothetical protein
VCESDHGSEPIGQLGEGSSDLAPGLESSNRLGTLEVNDGGYRLQEDLSDGAVLSSLDLILSPPNLSIAHLSLACFQR